MHTNKSGIFAGIMLIGLGILVFTGWWWPGIMLVIGTALAVDKYMQGQVKEAVGLFLLFLAIPAVVMLFNSQIISWTILAPILLIGIGGWLMMRTLLKRAQA
jgi:hypothetical protein